MKSPKHPLAIYREANGRMSQAAAAKLVGITQAHWSRVEAGLAHCRPRIARRISDLTGIPLTSLLDFSDNRLGRNKRRPNEETTSFSNDLP